MSFVENIKYSVLDENTPLDHVVEMINKAYLVESFFRKPGTYDRISLEEAAAIVAKKEALQHVYLIGCLDEDLVVEDVVYPAHQPICVICIDWEIELRNATSGQQVMKLHHEDLVPSVSVCGGNPSALSALVASTTLPKLTLSVHGHFGQVSVDPRLTRRGVGANLIAAAERFLVDKANTYTTMLQEMGLDVTLEAIMGMHVLNVRKDVLKWYPKFGYKVVQSGLPFDMPEILNEEYEGKVDVNILEKRLV